MIMQHLLIAYDVFVIMIGLAALSISLSWVLRTGEADLRNFCILYGLFTASMLLSVLRKYVALNVAGYSASTWAFLAGLRMVVDGAVLVATIHFLLVAYRISTRRPLMFASALTYVIVSGLLFTPIGTHLDANNRVLHFGIGYELARLWYIAAFTLLMVIGWGWIGRVWSTERRGFFLGLMIFATVGYIENLIGVPRAITASQVIIGTEGGLLVSSIPYALYGVFVIVFLLRYFVPVAVNVDRVFEAFLAKYAVTGRERDIILKLVEGKSNVDIARELVLSVATVKTHVHNIYAKIGVASRYDLLARVRSGQ
jgi:DNA-binding CsgD family transcriptional regulator